MNSRTRTSSELPNGLVDVHTNLHRVTTTVLRVDLPASHLIPAIMATSNGSALSAASSARSSSLHTNILREIKKEKEVFKKYEIVEVLGEGSMGSVSKVRKKDSAIGGSANETPKKKGLFGLGLFHKKDQAFQSRFHSNHHEDYIYALKSIQLDRVSTLFLEELKNEIDILRSLDHPNIVKAYEVFYGRRQIYLVLELCDGGDLFT